MLIVIAISLIVALIVIEALGITVVVSASLAAAVVRRMVSQLILTITGTAATLGALNGVVLMAFVTTDVHLMVLVHIITDILAEVILVTRVALLELLSIAILLLGVVAAPVITA